MGSVLYIAHQPPFLLKNHTTYSALAYSPFKGGYLGGINACAHASLGFIGNLEGWLFSKKNKKNELFYKNPLHLCNMRVIL